MQFFSHKFQDEQELKEIAHFNKLLRNQITVFLVFCYLCSVFFIKGSLLCMYQQCCASKYFELHAPVQVTFLAKIEALSYIAMSYLPTLKSQKSDSVMRSEQASVASALRPGVQGPAQGPLVGSRGNAPVGVKGAKPPEAPGLVHFKNQ